MKIIKQTQYLLFEDYESETKTTTIAVISIDSNEVIGIIKWDVNWRQYCFFPETDSVWNMTCLNDINAVIQKLMLDRKEKK